MDHVYWLARILGPFFLIVGIWMVVRNQDIMKVWTSVRNNPGLLYMGGILNLLIGFTVLSTYSEWSMSLPVLITLVGYLMVVRGLLVLFATNWVLSKVASFTSFGRAWAAIPLFFGIGISYLAFCM